jgi:endonuclease YncB( thermonuclease family)
MSTRKTKAREEIDVLRYLGELPIGKVLRVYDGDTVLVSLAGEAVKVRLDSIDCPEEDQPWGSTATAGLIKLIGGKSVRLEVYGLDDYGRTLATLYVQNVSSAEWTNVNERMLLLGHAWVMQMYLDHLPHSRQAKLLRLQDWSRSKGVGLWGTEAPVPPWTWKGAKKDLS